MTHPATRPRRTRQSDAWRRMVRETRLSSDALIYPLFAVPGRGVRHPVSSMPGVSQLSVDELAKDAKAVAAQAITAVKDACPDLLVWADVCLCGATDHGHCGHVLPGGAIDNDSSVETLAQVALNYARAGADAVAPSDMMDGRVQAMRRLLDREGHAMTPIVSYAAKYASSFYGPFREAAESAPAFGDRRSYQMDPANSREALREVLLDVGEGADLVMVKPAGPYLDVIRQVRDAVRYPARGRGSHHHLLRARGGALARRPMIAP